MYNFCICWKLLRILSICLVALCEVPNKKLPLDFDFWGGGLFISWIYSFAKKKSEAQTYISVPSP